VSSPELLDVLVIGAGLSGVGAAYRLQTECPTKKFAIVEARDAIGGTWDLFRYPGVRSDSDMFTLGYPFHPWREARAIADGPSILAYIRETAETYGITKHIRFNHKVTRASWSSAKRAWTVSIEGRPDIEARFLYLCSGYYSYDDAHKPEFSGREKFKGRIVHPQWWPADLDHAGKRVVVIGSGATAVTLVPAMAETAAHVTMLQRSPSYLFSLPATDPVADAVRGRLPERLAHRIVRGKNMLVGLAFYQFCRRFPERARKWLLEQIASALPDGYPVDPDFSPRYQPWDQRMCLIPDQDFLKSISSGKASIVTDTIETFTETGIKTTSGKVLEADVIVTATGLKLQPIGGIKLTVDGRAIEARDLVVYRGLMLDGVPNLAWCVGYTNASWTLRADLSSRYVCRLLNLMDRKGHAVAVPRADLAPAERRPLLDLTSGYIARAADDLPKQGTRRPWSVRQNYLFDLMTMRLGKVTESMEFSR
jgi:cation diffusion facilitator CzcD-associated flavoprotein CzcO